jgi:hypothetical protein
MSDQAVAGEALGRIDRARARSRSPFYVGFAIVLLLIVVAGFSPTFFLNAFMAKRDLPPHVILHGVVATSWFVLLIVQTALVANRRTKLHKSLGLAAGIVAASAFTSTVVAAIFVFPRAAQAGIDHDTLAGMFGMTRAAQVTHDTLAVTGFAVLVSFAYALRRRTETHKRLMLFASMALSGAAIPRLFGFTGLAAFAPGAAAVFVIYVPLILAVIVNDLLTTRRVHPATSIGGSTLLAYYVAVLYGTPALIH